MTHGKKTCKILKEIRQQIAERNDIEYITSECHFQGECKGTCPKCEEELQYLENELSKRRQLGKAVAVAGISLGIVGSFSACNPQKQENIPITEQKTAIDTVIMDTIPAIQAMTSKKNRYKKVHILKKDSLIELQEYIVKGERPIIEMGTTESFFGRIAADAFPGYPGGDYALVKFIQENLVYPKKAKKQRIEGEVIVSFVVKSDGSLTNFEIIKSVHHLLDKEALRIVKLMPKWTPGVERFDVVKLPINFTLDDNK